MSEPAEDGGIASVLCPNCGRSNPELRHFCVQCGAPISPLSTIGPAETPLAEGFAYRQAVSGPPKKVILIGMWLLFGPSLAIALYLLATMIRQHRTLGFDRDAAGMLVGMLLFGAISGILLFRTTRNYRKKRRMVEPGGGG